MTTSQAPSVNLLISSTASATAVNTAPAPLIAARRATRGRAAHASAHHARLGQREPHEHADGDSGISA